MKRFEKECEFMSTIRHPNVVQYLGTREDPETHLPLLLMELMDGSLTSFVDSHSPSAPIHYHVQVNISHDIALALSFLHSNNIIHRDLSSNNVLMIGNVRAKVTDFGMASLYDLEQLAQETQLSFTHCPGATAYMPPEAVKDKPAYTEKIDCFSFGVILIQILTLLFPKPGDRYKEVEANHIRYEDRSYPKGVIEVRIPESERRRDHISKADRSNPLLSVALECLSDDGDKRPSAQNLCARIADLKGKPKYSESLETIDSQRTQDIISDKDQIIAQKDRALEEKNNIITRMQTENRRLRDAVRKEKQYVTEQSTNSIDSFHTTNSDSINLTWTCGRTAPCKMSSRFNAAVDKNATVHVRVNNTQVYAYHFSRQTWSKLPNCPVSHCPSVIVNSTITLVGGYYGGAITNKLFSLVAEGTLSSSALISYTGGEFDWKWKECFPAMLSKRYESTALGTGTALIVVGGDVLSVEVMNTVTYQWSVVADLPELLKHPSAVICGNSFYVLGRSAKSVYSCLLTTLPMTRPRVRSDIVQQSRLQEGQFSQSRPISDGKLSLRSIFRNPFTSASEKSPSCVVWNKLEDLPVLKSTCVSFLDRLISIGGEESEEMRPTNAVHLYDPIVDSWTIISRMSIARYNSFVAVLPNSRLMVIGGITNVASNATAEIEIAQAGR
jgi:serine/threonine protein kinase